MNDGSWLFNKVFYTKSSFGATLPCRCNLVIFMLVYNDTDFLWVLFTGWCSSTQRHDQLPRRSYKRITAAEGGYCARASNFSVRPSVLSVCWSRWAQNFQVSDRQKGSFKAERRWESLIFIQKIQVSGESKTFWNVTVSNYHFEWCQGHWLICWCTVMNWIMSITTLWYHGYKLTFSFGGRPAPRV